MHCTLNYNGQLTGNTGIHLRLSVDVFNVRGSRVARVVDRAAGGWSVSWRPSKDVAPGLYFVRLSGAKETVVRRVTRLE